MRYLTLIFALVFALPLAASEIGDDGLHKADWLHDTFKDMAEDLGEANAEGKRFMVIVEQRGCIYCKKMHEEVFSRDNVKDYINENFFAVRLNLHGSTEVTDFDGDAREERAMARKWGLLFTPTILFFPTEVGDTPAPQAAVAMMPGAFGAGTTLDMLTWVVEERYLDVDGEDFQRYHARRIEERRNGSTD